MQKMLFTLAGPLAALLLVIFTDLSPGNPAITYMAGVVIWMAIWWLSEAIPLSVTALLPIVLYPLLGIMSAKDVAPNYFNSILFLFMGGFIIAIAMERWDLHRRIALSIIHMVGSSKRRLLLGFMIATAFLSMWISNTATSMMMVPIALAVLIKLEEVEDSSVIKHYSIGLFLAIAYAANIGGMATLIGSPPNLAFMGIFRDQFPNAPEISFSQWMSFGIPVSLTMLVFVWGYLTFLFTRSPSTDEVREESGGFFKEQYESLGKMSSEERWVMLIFSLTAILWITRSSMSLGDWTLSGWGQFFPLADDSTVAITMAALLFLLPSTATEHGRLLHWDDLDKFPWGILILFGGGFALADGFRDSGLSMWLGEQMMSLGDFPPVVLVATACTSMTFLTEFTSNTPSTQMLLPILASLSVSTGLHPLLLMIPTTLCASCAFMLPVATPPNAIVFGTRRVPIVEMAKAGLIVNLAGVVIITTLILIMGKVIFGIELESTPAWVTK